MPPKHTVDPTTQGSMLAPPATSLRTGVMEEVDGAFFRTPDSGPETLSPEEQALKMEADALYLLGRACRTQQNINNMSKGLRALRDHRGYDADPTEAFRLEGAIARSEETYYEFRRGAKTSFAQSIGIETVIKEEEKTVEGTPRMVRVVRAKDSEWEAELASRYKDFYAQYGDVKQADARTGRRRQILGSIRSQSAQ